MFKRRSLLTFTVPPWMAISGRMFWRYAPSQVVEMYVQLTVPPFISKRGTSASSRASPVTFVLPA